MSLLKSTKVWMMIFSQSVVPQISRFPRLNFLNRLDLCLRVLRALSATFPIRISNQSWPNDFSISNWAPFRSDFFFNRTIVLHSCKYYGPVLAQTDWKAIDHYNIVDSQLFWVSTCRTLTNSFSTRQHYSDGNRTSNYRGFKCDNDYSDPCWNGPIIRTPIPEFKVRVRG